ncbi:MAG TPA: hypothetical protein VFX43_18420 [Chitinophagaceae bacterium]|nr:hypothetical protein [Chitinophagaceae bacterium]
MPEKENLQHNVCKRERDPTMPAEITLPPVEHFSLVPQDGFNPFYSSPGAR